MVGRADAIFKNIQQYVPLEEDEKEWLMGNFQQLVVPKKCILSEQGSLARNFYYVQEGSVRAYNINNQGRESTIMFAITDWWITDMGAFMSQSQASVSLETLQDSVLLALSYDSMQSLFTEMPKLERYFRILFQNAYIREQARLLDWLSLPLENRYKRFLMKYPQVAQSISQKQLASYLGVTPEFLSHVKSKMA